MRGKAFVRASGSSAVIRRSENARIFDSFESKLPASVTPRSRAAPVRPRCPETLVLGSSKLADVRARATNMCGGTRTRPEGVLLVCHDFHASVH